MVHSLDDACPYEAAFLKIHSSDLDSDLAALGAALASLTGLLQGAESADPEWLEDGGHLPCAFLQTQLLCRGSPQDYLRRLWTRRQGNAGGLDLIFQDVAEALTGDQDPWALATPAARTYCFPSACVDAGPVKLRLRDGDYSSSGPGRFVYGAAEALSHIILGRLGGLDVRGKKVLELGCGVGLVGLACLAAGAQAVTLTDFDLGSLAACSDNVDMNVGELGKERSQARCLPLDWANACGAVPDLLAGAGRFAPFDLVVGADLCYSQDHASLLLSALSALAGGGCFSEDVGILILNGWPNVGLRRFEHLVAASPSRASEPIRVVGTSPQEVHTAPTGVPTAVAPHVRHFLQDEGTELDDRRSEEADGRSSFHCMDIREVVGCTDERGAPANFRLYRLSARC